MAKSKKKPALPAKVYISPDNAEHQRMIAYPSAEVVGRLVTPGDSVLAGEYTLTRMVRISTSVALSPE